MSDDDNSKKDEASEETSEEEKDINPSEEATEEQEKEKEADKPEDKSGSTDATATGVDQQGRQLYKVKCSNCGKDTEVPFQPSGDRPVYCRDCYMQKKNG